MFLLADVARHQKMVCCTLLVVRGLPDFYGACTLAVHGSEVDRWLFFQSIKPLVKLRGFA